jgi:hypothetical protein
MAVSVYCGKGSRTISTMPPVWIPYGWFRYCDPTRRVWKSIPVAGALGFEGKW